MLSQGNKPENSVKISYRKTYVNSKNQNSEAALIPRYSSTECNHSIDSLLAEKPNHQPATLCREEMVKRIRAQGGCLGTKSR